MQETGSHRATEIGRPLAATGRRPTAETPDASVSTHKLQRENTDASAGKIDLNSPNFRQQRHHRFHPGYIGSVPRQNSPSAPSGRCAPRKNSPSTPQSGTHRDKIRPANPQSGTHRDKTRPAQPPAGALRDKTLPARPNQARTATKLALHGKIRPFWPIFGALGEKYRAFYAGTRSRASFIPQTTTHQPRSAHSPVQNSPGTQRVRPQPVQNSPRTRRVRPQPVQNSPSTAKNTQISPFEASREKIIPVETETTDAGRILSRRPPHTSHAGHTHRDKTLPARPHTGAHRYKNLPAQQKTPKSAHSRRAGRKLSRSRPARDTNNRRRTNFIPQTTTH